MQEKRLFHKEEILDKKIEQSEQKEKKLAKKEKDIEATEEALKAKHLQYDELIASQRKELEKVAGMLLYWLHGGFGNARQGAWAVHNFDAAIKKRTMPKLIIVLVQALPVGWYVDSKHGRLPTEQVIIKDLIPHVDSTYRTIAQKGGRGIEGHSMGGFGALHLGLKFPHLFGAISAVAPSILRNLSDEPLFRTYYTFDNDQSYYEQVGPWNLAKANAHQLRAGNTYLRILSGANDTNLQPTLHEYHRWLEEFHIRHLFVEVKDAGHAFCEPFSPS